MPDQYISELLNRFFRGTISVPEKESLARWVQESGEEDHIKELMQQSWQQFEPQETLPQAKANELLQSILFQAKSQEKQPAKLIGMHRRRWNRIAVAASIVIALGLGSYFTFFNKPAKQDEIVKLQELPNDVKAPETNRAMITLANGQKVYLDSVANGSLAMQEGVSIEKLADGRIVYTGISTEVVYNTLSNPRGSKAIDMTLADGSKVWLNAGSSVTFPIAFVGNERKVEISGEAYLDVTHNPAMPFKLKKGDMEVTVLGTKFNVNAYDDEADIKVTLLEGSVKVSNGPANGILKPGQQAQVGRDIKIVSNVDIEEVMAWKNGKFQFGEKADIGMIMRQIARWYEVDVVYDGAVPKQRFGGEMPRNSNLSQVLEILKTSGVKFTIEGRKVTIRP